jgi:hypothetical protein
VKCCGKTFLCFRNPASHRKPVVCHPWQTPLVACDEPLVCTPRRSPESLRRARNRRSGRERVVIVVIRY